MVAQTSIADFVGDLLMPPCDRRCGRDVFFSYHHKGFAALSVRRGKLAFEYMIKRFDRPALRVGRYGKANAGI